ncbi:MAG: SEL1-like repeat protein, partial [Nitratireductor sp.]|nr:SEL1-like repeat protein [Nitratireductor sp.]
MEKLRQDTEIGSGRPAQRMGGNPIDAVERQLQRGNAQSGAHQQAARPSEAPRRPISPLDADAGHGRHGAQRDERQYRPAPDSRRAPQAQHGNSSQDIGRIRDGIDALADKLAALGAQRPAPSRAETMAVTPDQIDSLAREMRGEFVRMREELDQTIQSVGQSLGQSLGQTLSQSIQSANTDSQRDDFFAGELQRIADGIAAIQGSPAGEPAFLDEIAAELHHMRQEIAHITAQGSPQIDLGGVARSIESGYAEIAARLEETVTTAIRNGAVDDHDHEMINHIIMLSDHVTAIRDRMEGMSLEAVQQHVEELSEVVTTLSGTGNQSLSANFGVINDRLDEITRALVAVSINPPGGLDALDRIEARMTSLSKAIDKVADDNAAASANLLQADIFESGLAELSRKFDDWSQQHLAGSSSAADHDSLTARLDEIASRLDVMAESSGQEMSSPAIEGIFNGLDALSGRLDRLSETGLQSSDIDASGILVSRLDEIADQLARMTQENQFRLGAVDGSGGADGEHVPTDAAMTANVEAVLSVIESQLTAIFDRLPEPGAATGLANGAANSEIMSMLAVLSERIEKVAGSSPADLPDAEQLSALEIQLAGIASHLTTIGANGFDLEPLNQRLENIELQVANSRDIAMDAAAEAAERAARMVAGNKSTGADYEPDGELVSQLAADLRNLEESTRHLGEMHAQSFESVRDTMSMIADRLGDIEQHLQSASQAAHHAARPGYGEDHGSGFDSTRHDYSAPHRAGHEADYASADSHRSHYSPSMSGDRESVAAYAGDELMDEQGGATYMPARTTHGRDPVSRHGHDGDLPPLDDAPSLHMDDLPELHEDNYGTSGQAGNSADQGAYHDETDRGDSAEQSALPDDDIPLEPGSGVPDLEALMRQATARRRGGQPASASPTATSDLIAQKRREAQAAAQAAAQMAAAASAQKAEAPEKAQKSRGKLPNLGALGGIGAILTGRKKLLMGGAAILLLAAMAGPMLSMVMGSGEPELVAASPVDPTQAGAAEEAAANPGSSDEIQADATEAAGDTTRSGDLLASTADQPASDLGGSSVDMTNAGADTVSVPAVPEEVGNAVLRQAAEAGDPQALFEVARRYTDGDGMEQNLDTARQWYEISARAGYAPAQYRLANFLEKGHGGPQDLEKAAMWYQRAAEQGNALAMHNLAVLYAGGLLSSGQDMEAATEWFAKAGELGVKDSQVNLGILYTRGKGVEENLVEAYKWFAIAANGGDADAAQKRDTLAGSMRPDQLQTARGLVELWKPAELNAEANSVTPNPAWTTIPGLSAETPPEVLSPKEMVRRSQEMLAKLGFDPGPADGLMGNKTREA